MTVTVFTKPACVQCDATVRALKKANIAHRKVDVSVDTEARDFIISLGYLQAPVVVTDTEHWSGFRPDKLRALGSIPAAGGRR